MKKLLYLVLILFFIIPVAMARLAAASGTAALTNSPALAPIKKLKKPLPYTAPAEVGSSKEALNLKAASRFKMAVSLMREARDRQALSEFRASRAGLPFLGDYICFYEARAYWELKEPERAAACLDELLKNNPRSPLAEKARLMAIGMAGDKDTLIKRLEDFTKRYPGHDGLELKLAQLLTEKGKAHQARGLLKKIYDGAGALSVEALAELGGSPSPEETLARAGNLLRRAHPHEAAHELLLLPDDPAYSKEKMELLGRALFMQKRYNEAAAVYEQTGDLYNAARSYFRANDEEDLKKEIDALSGAGDRKASYLMLDLASLERRKDNNFAGAIKELNDAREKYPRVSEYAMWETGWLYYMQKDYKDAEAVFSDLGSLYDDPKYLYWTARSLEELGGSTNEKSASDIYKKLVSEDEGYYSVLASMRTGMPVKEDELPEQAARKLTNSTAFKRFTVLMIAGLKNSALSDLSYSARGCMDRDTLVWIANQLKKLGAFRSAIAVAMRLPGDMQPRNVLYPRAFWGSVKKDCSETGMDPYLVLSVMREESSFDPTVCSRAGAIGLMQLMPKTAEKYSVPLRIAIKNKKSIYGINANVALGTFYLDKLFNDFKAIPPTLAAYNAGEAVVRKWLAQGNYSSFDEFVEDIPYGETKNYIKRIITTYYRYGGEEASKDFFIAAKTDNP